MERRSVAQGHEIFALLDRLEVRDPLIVREMEGGSEDDIHELFDVDIAAGESGAGDWSLNVVDNLTGDAGTLDRWTLGINRPAP